MANDFAVAKIPVSLIGITLPALTFALSIDRILNGLTRPFFGGKDPWIFRKVIPCLGVSGIEAGNNDTPTPAATSARTV